MKKWIAALLSAAMLVSLAACGGGGTGSGTPSSSGNAPGSSSGSSAGASGSASGTETPANDTITLVNTSPIPDFDPLNWYITSQSTLFTNVYSTLVDVIVNDDLTVSLRPNLAKSWESDESGLSWTFHLNENAVYSDGSKVTARHVKTCFERQLDNPYTMSYVSMIESVEAPDDNTVVIHLNKVWPSVPNCWYMVAIYNTDLYDADREGYIKNPVGSGPYTLTALDETAGTMTMELKDDWWGDEKPTVHTIQVRTITDMSTLVIALQKGEVDTANLTGTNLRLVEGDSSLTMKESLSLVPYQLLINPAVEPLNNAKLREAISYAIDYDAIRNATCSGYISSKDNHLVFATPEMEIPEGVPTYEYNPEKAKELVAESGLPTPVNVGEIIGGNNNGSAEMVQQFLSAVGIEAQVTSYETNTFVEMLMQGKFGLGITTGSGGQSAFENLLNYYGTGQPYNFNKFSNPEVDSILEQLQTTTDQAATADLLKQALTVVHDQYTNLNLGIPAQYVVSSARFTIPPVWNGVDMIRVR